MGMDYHLHCDECNKNSEDIEFSVVKYLQLKFPSDAEMDLLGWSAFLIEHSGHEIAFLDSFGKETNPAKIDGAYVLGLNIGDKAEAQTKKE